VLRWLLSLFGRRRSAEAEPIREKDAYLHSYGDRSGEILSVERVPDPEPEPVSGANGEMTGELLRRAFEAKLDARSGGKASTAA
jgi:hypothetical protein